MPVTVMGAGVSGGWFFGRCPALGWESGGRTLAGAGLLLCCPFEPGTAPALKGPGPGQVGKEPPAAPPARQPQPGPGHHQVTGPAAGPGVLAPVPFGHAPSMP